MNSVHELKEWRRYSGMECSALDNVIDLVEKEIKDLEEQIENNWPRCCKCNFGLSKKSIICRSCEGKGELK
jgi:hypothetical protein